MATPPETLTLKGTIRDFKSYVPPTATSAASGHIDFENVNRMEKGIVKVQLGADKKPEYAGGNNPPGEKTTQGKEPFDQWYRDVPGVNQTIPYDITLKLDPATQIYTFDSRDPALGLNNDGLGGFFPIDGQGFGNENRVHNYSFTYEIHTHFTFQGYESFTFTGDDDLWVFIDNRLVIDLGGVHSAQKATVDLKGKKIIYHPDNNPYPGELPLNLELQVGATYDLDIFFAERHTRRSIFRIDTSLVLESVEIAPPTGSNSSQ
jgi:fibro-slime domain-containing protein